MACRWGNARSPAYGTLSDYQFMRRHTSTEKRAQKARQSWGATLNGVDSVAAVFAKYTKGEAADVLLMLAGCTGAGWMQ